MSVVDRVSVWRSDSIVDRWVHENAPDALQEAARQCTQLPDTKVMICVQAQCL
jgi:hypothetical protein